MASVLETSGFELSVSSILLGDEETSGPQHMIDGTDDTCWSSANGSPQFIEIAFAQPHRVSSLNVTFQGGFTGQDIILYVATDSEATTWTQVNEVGIFLDDSNAEQRLALAAPWENTPISKLKATFRASSDLFGRISVYHLKVEGEAQNGGA